MSLFAADLHAVALGEARPVYRDPTEFFSLTYPTFALRDLAKDVTRRLAGQSDKAVRQLELTYGGGKTHTLITLYHLVRDPAALPDLPAVAEFVNHIGVTPPKARVAVLAVRQARRGEGDGGARARRRRPLAQAPLERARLPDRRRRGAPHAPPRGQGRGARERPRREPAGLAARPPPAGGPGHAGPDRRGADVRAGEGGARPCLARPHAQLLPVLDAGRRPRSTAAPSSPRCSRPIRGRATPWARSWRRR